MWTGKGSVKMKVTKAFMIEVLQEVVGRYEEEVCPIGNEVRLAFIDKEEFLEVAKQNRLIQEQMRIGIYKRFEEEYPNFMVVFKEGKHPVLAVMGLPYRVTVCFDIAKKRLKPFGKEEVRAYLSYMYAHELTHIVQDRLKMSNPGLWEKALAEADQAVDLAHEVLAEDVAARFGDYAKYRKVEDGIWGVVNNRVRRITEAQRRLGGKRS